MKPIGNPAPTVIDADRWRRITEIFLAALGHDGPARARFVQEAAEDDEPLRREVEALLASDERAGTFLEPPAAGSAPNAASAPPSDVSISEEADNQGTPRPGDDELLEVARGGLDLRRPFMALVPGSRLERFEILALLGAGGMGEVYRARDPRLKRDVAIKVLPRFLSTDPDRLGRFEQEAQAAAALNHPNILAVHEMGTCEGAPYLVSELLEGETLREQLARGHLAARKAIGYGVQIARGLAAAHEKGIAHRDLKPENLFVTRDGRVKILDFGLAKLFQAQPGSEHSAMTRGDKTEPGLLMGTVGYMAPEQVRGQAADHRSDIFAVGAILYEMLAGKRAFQKATPAETMTAILNDDPPPIAQHVGINAPPALQRVVHRCLEKNPELRFQSTADLEFALDTLSDSSGASIVPTEAATHLPWRTWLRLAAEVALLGIALIILLRPHASGVPSPQLQAAILPPPGDGFWGNITQPAAISPDGRFLAIVAMRNGQRQLWLRRLDASDAQPIDGSDGAFNPFWSPDSRSIAFFVTGKLKRVDISGGSVSDICQAGRFGMGGAWSSRGVIIFATFGERLRRVSDRGGAPEPIVGAELSSDALAQFWPSFLPDGEHFLYLDWRYSTHDGRENGVWIGSLNGEKARRLALSSTNVSYSEGRLLFVRDGDLAAQKFDPSRLELSGPVFPIAKNIHYDTFFHYGMFTVSSIGTLVYGTAGVGVNTRLTWMDRNGKTFGVLGEPGTFFRHSISPDGSRVAVGVKPGDAREKIWIYDVDRGTRIPLVNSESGSALYSPVWSPDGKQVAYRNTVGKSSTLLAHNADGSGDERQPGSVHFELLRPTDWSPDGHCLAVESTKFQGRLNWQNRLSVVRVDGSGEPLLEIDDAGGGKFSPDGHWLAYNEDKTGQVYVTPFPGPWAGIAVSSAGGADPRWRGDGQELFYVTNDRMIMSVQVRESAREFRVLSSQPLFRLQLPNNVGFYDVTRDGKRFLVNMRTSREQTAPLTVLTNWPHQLRKETGGELPGN